jgi:hypothetical protein
MGFVLAGRHRGPLWGALEEIRGHVKAGYQAVYDADLKGFLRFDSARQASGLCAHASGGPERPQADPDVAGDPARRGDPESRVRRASRSNGVGHARGLPKAG